MSTKSSTLELGQSAPAFTLPTQEGALLSSADLAGQPYVLFFYPAASTPGCTTETADFTALAPEFAALGVRLIGLSADSVKKQLNFATKLRTPFDLLSDSEALTATAYDVWKEKKSFGKTYMGIVRSTFLIDADGKIAALWSPVKVAGHAQAVLDAAAALAR